MDKKFTVLLICFKMVGDAISTLNNFAIHLKKSNGLLIVGTQTFFSPEKIKNFEFQILRIPSSLSEYSSEEMYWSYQCTTKDSHTSRLLKVHEHWWGQSDKRSHASAQIVFNCTNVAEKVLIAIRPSIAFFWSSGIYPTSQIWHDVARQMGIPSFCLEQGFLTGTWMIDLGGMNAQSEMLIHPLIRKLLLTHTQTEKAEIYRQWYQANNPRKREILNKENCSLRRTHEAKSKIISFFGSLDNGAITPRNILGSEINLPGYADSKDVVRAISNACKSIEGDFEIIFKPHPGEKSNYTSEYLYTARIVNECDPIDLILASDIVISGISTISFDALLNNRPLILVARSVLIGTDLAYEALKPEELKDTILKALDTPCSSTNLFNCFIDGLLSYTHFSLNPYVPALPIEELAQHCIQLRAIHGCNLSLAQKTLDHTFQATAVAQLFFDTGTGFNEKQSITLHYKTGIEETLHFTLPSELKTINQLRIDPSNKLGKIHIYSIGLTNSAGEVFLTHISNHNANWSFDNTFIFNHNDPQLIINPPHTCTNDLRSITLNIKALEITKNNLPPTNINILNLSSSLESVHDKINTLLKKNIEKDTIGRIHQNIKRADAQLELLKFILLH